MSPTISSNNVICGILKITGMTYNVTALGQKTLNIVMAKLDIIKATVNKTVVVLEVTKLKMEHHWDAIFRLSGGIECH